LAEEKKIEVSPQKQDRKKFRFFSYALLILCALMLLITLVASVTQTGIFRGWIKDFLVSKINDNFSSKFSTISIGEIQGNFFSEIIIKDASFKVKNDEMMSFDWIKIKYNIFGLLDKHVDLTEVTLENPKANFFRIRDDKGDSVWNVIYVFETAKDTLDVATEFNWKIDVKRLRINNLNYIMYGALPYDASVLNNIHPEKSITSENLKIGALNFEARAEYDKNAIKLWIYHFGFHSNFGFDLKGLSGDFYLSSSRAEINKLNIETSRSWIQSEYIFIDKINLINFEDLQGLESFKGKDKQLRLALVTKNFHFDDLKAFLPQVNFLDDEVYLNLKCKGIFDDILVESLNLRTQNSNFEFAGRMTNLTEPDKLWFDIKANNLRIDPRDTKIYTPGLQIPDYSHVGLVTGDLTYKGEPVNFESTFDVKSSVGNVKGFFNLNLNAPNYAYSTSVDASGVNIGKLLKDQKLESNINGKIEANGSGFDLANINTTVRYEVRDTKIYEQRIDKSAGVVNLRGYNIEADITYVSGRSDATVKGNINVRDFTNPVYNLKGQVRNFDVSAFTKDPADKSSLTFTFDLNGRGISPEDFQGTYNINLANSYYGDYEFLATPIDLKISTTGAEDYVTLNSNLIDFNARGNFTIPQIADVVMSNVVILQNEISKKFNLDTLLPVKPVRVNSSNMDFTYELKTKDPQAVSKLFFLNDLYFAGDVKGAVKNSQSGFDGKTNINLKSFAYKDSVFVLKDAHAELSHSNNYSLYKDSPRGDFNSFATTINFNADTVRFSGRTFDSVDAKFELEDAVQNFSFNAVQDTTIKADIAGRIDLASDSVTFYIERLFVSYDKIRAKNDDVLIACYRPYESNQLIDFDNFHISGDYIKLNVGGYYSFNSSSDMFVEATDVGLQALMELIQNQGNSNKNKPKYTVDNSPFKGTIRRALLSYKGTRDDPSLSFEMNTSMLRYENNRIGRVDAFIDYANQNLATDILVSNVQRQGSLRLTGNVPFTNPLQAPDSASYMAVFNNPLDLKLKATNFQINFFSKLIPNFSDIRGFLNGEITASGTVAEPILAGNATIEKGRMFFSWTGSYYRFEAAFKTDNSDLVIEKFSLYNDFDRARHIDVFGRINFAGLSINDIDLTTSGDMYVLDESSIQNRFGFYGEMLAGIGEPPIRIKGNLSNLLVSGQLIIKSARIFFPAISSMAYDVYADDFTYKILTDPAGDKYLDTTITVSEEELATIDPFLRYNYILEKREPSVADYITYDLAIVMEKSVYVNMKMNNLTREELNAEFKGDLKLDNRTPDKRFQLFGRMNIIGDSYYRFYKNFRIQDSYLDFIGDYNDPSLNIKAEYKNIRTIPDKNEQEIMYVVLSITGTRYKPELTLSLRTDAGSEITGDQAQSDAMSYLLFGAPLSATQGGSALSNLGTNFGSGLASSYLYEVLRNIAPFILNTEVIYSGGDISTTDIRVTSAFGDAIVRFGGKILTDINNFEVSVEYPLNKLFNVGVSNNLLIEIAREYTTSIFKNAQGFESKVGLTYRIRY
jgi:hypothetical protein